MQRTCRAHAHARAHDTRSAHAHAEHVHVSKQRVHVSSMHLHTIPLSIKTIIYHSSFTPKRQFLVHTKRQFIIHITTRRIPTKPTYTSNPTQPLPLPSSSKFRLSSPSFVVLFVTFCLVGTPFSANTFISIEMSFHCSTLGSTPVGL